MKAAWEHLRNSTMVKLTYTPNPFRVVFACTSLLVVIEHASHCGDNVLARSFEILVRSYPPLHGYLIAE